MHMRPIPALLLTGALTAAPLLLSTAADAHTATTASGAVSVLAAPAAGDEAPAGERSMSFALLKQEIKDDATYGLVEEYTFTVTNTGTVPTDTSLRAFNDRDESYLDAHGQEMWLGGCDWQVPGMEPGRTITCRMDVRIMPDELAAGKTTAQHVHFRGWAGQEKAFEGFRTESLTIPAEFLPAPEETPSSEPSDAPTSQPSTDPSTDPSDTAPTDPSAAPSASASSEPSATATAASTAAPAEQRAAGQLPRTGSESGALIAGAAGLLALGGAAVAVTLRRRLRSQD